MRYAVEVGCALRYATDGPVDVGAREMGAWVVERGGDGWEDAHVVIWGWRARALELAGLGCCGGRFGDHCVAGHGWASVP
jgi:hypothetical protein